MINEIVADINISYHAHFFGSPGTYPYNTKKYDFLVLGHFWGFPLGKLKIPDFPLILLVYAHSPKTLK